MSEHVLFPLVFLSQILLISLYFPAKIYNRMTSLFEKYPPDTYPKLYPGPTDNYARTRRRFRQLGRVILFAGLLILAALPRYPHDNDLHNAIATGYFFLQFLPLLFLELSSLSCFKRMRSANSATTRRAELSPRRLFDFISPMVFGIAVVVYVAFVLFIAYMRQFEYPWFGGYLNILGITAMNLILAGIAAFYLYGIKLDPHQAPEDRSKLIGTTI